MKMTFEYFENKKCVYKVQVYVSWKKVQAGDFKEEL